MWHKWNVNADDVIMMWFALFANLAMSCLACVSCMCMHGACDLYKYGASKYPSGLAFMQANLNLECTTVVCVLLRLILVCTVCGHSHIYY